MSDRTHQHPYTYYAFISYKRVDGKWAAWLQHKLQSYRLPKRLYKQYRTLPKRLTPIFLDKENLTSGELEKSLENELAASRYLIVICSRAAHDLLYYLDKEIRAFLNVGHTTTPLEI